MNTIMCLETFRMRNIILRMRGSLVMGVVKRRQTNVAITSVLLSLGSVRRLTIFKLMAGMLPFDSFTTNYFYHSYSYNINTNKYLLNHQSVINSHPKWHILISSSSFFTMAPNRQEGSSLGLG
jgi:hypothetical protein